MELNDWLRSIGGREFRRCESLTKYAWIVNFVALTAEELLCKFLSTHSGSVEIYGTYEISILGHALINYVTYIIVLAVVKC